MKIIALVSGGKDSLFALQKEVQAGHTLLCIANLYPVETDELDSYMYQSVGHEVIGLIAEALEVPIYRRAILGKPLVTEIGYDGQEGQQKGDEVEDLFELLKEIKEAHPEAEAVVSGAINSTYQKNRVENVCERLGLQSLAPLWEHDPVDLLQSMIASGMHAILIKVASYGLGKNDCGKSLSEMEAKLLKYQNELGIHCCGEGGEFESLTLDSPLYKKRIVL